MDSVTVSDEDETTYLDDYLSNFSTEQSLEIPTDVISVLETTAYVIIMVLGITGNSLVIWIAGFKIKKTVNTVWYLSLAVSDFLFCAFLSLHIVYIVKDEWVFGRFMCKFAPFILFLNMFSSIFLLVIISVDRCVMVLFPIWAQNKRTLRRALVIVLLAWIMSALLSLPEAIFRDVEHEDTKHICFDYNYTHDEELIAVVVCRFIFGFVIPLLIIIICSVLICQKLKYNQKLRSNRPFKVMAAVIAAFFICWMPYHLFNLILLNQEYNMITLFGIIIGEILASANSFINPLLYAFMGKDVKNKCYELLSKIEIMFEEEVQSTTGGMSITKSGDFNLSMTV